MADAPIRIEYANPPVAEAICQVSFASPVKWSVASPGLLFKEIESEYPTAPEGQDQFQARIATGEQGGLSLSQTGVQRFIYANEDSSRRLTANGLQISVNALQPYEKWPEFRLRFRRGLAQYSTAVGPFEPSTVSLRYINRIVVPDTRFDTSEYLTIPVASAHQPGSSVTGFMSRSESILGDGATRLTITFATLQPDQEDTSALLLDIEVVRDVAHDADLDALETVADELHTIENIEFESSITEKCRGLFR